MARARSWTTMHSLSTRLSESWDYLCGTSLPDGRFLTIYWPWEMRPLRSRTKSRIDFDWVEQLLNLQYRYEQGNDRRIPNTYFLKTNDLPLIDQEDFNL